MLLGTQLSSTSTHVSLRNLIWAQQQRWQQATNNDEQKQSQWKIVESYNDWLVIMADNLIEIHYSFEWLSSPFLWMLNRVWRVWTMRMYSIFQHLSCSLACARLPLRKNSPFSAEYTPVCRALRSLKGEIAIHCLWWYLVARWFSIANLAACERNCVLRDAQRAICVCLKIHWKITEY